MCPSCHIINKLQQAKLYIKKTPNYEKKATINAGMHRISASGIFSDYY